VFGRGDLVAAIAQLRTPSIADVSLDELADMLTSIIEGGIILSRVFNDKMALVQQIRQSRNYVKLLFSA